MNLSFSSDEIYNLQKFVMRGGSKTILEFSFDDDESSLPLDIITSTVVWTMSEFGQPDYTIITKQGTLSSDYSCIVTLNSSETKDIEGKFVQQVTLVDYLGDEYVVAQGIIKINKNNNNDM